jgi:hypothetical protein
MSLITLLFCIIAACGSLLAFLLLYREERRRALLREQRNLEWKEELKSFHDAIQNLKNKNGL